MILYSEYIMPWLLDRVMSKPVFARLRQDVLSNVQWNILEIGIGTGLNVCFYPEDVKKISSVDNNPFLHRLALKRSIGSGITIDHYCVSAESLPFEDASFDSVVCTWTFCSIAYPLSALEEIYRVLKIWWKFIFLEHGLSRDLKVAWWQNLLTPCWKCVSGGCHLDRDIKKMLSGFSFELTQYKEFGVAGMTPLASWMYQGVVVKK